MTIPAYPIQWPEGWKRTEPQKRATARFSTRRNSSSTAQPLSIADAVERVRRELAAMGIHDDDLVISSNLLLRLDGLPRSGQAEPSDPGVAVYWETKGERRCMAIDRYDRTADNLAAIAATLDAMRAIERHGGAEILNRAFTGFTALEHEQIKAWHVVLGVLPNTPTEQVRDAYKRARASTHPDRGGDAELFQNVQDAWSAFCKERGVES